MVDSIDLTVFGGPSTVELDVDFGPQGTRGSRIYKVSQNPNNLATQNLPQDLLPYDLAIVVDPANLAYLDIYQKTVNSWDKLFNFKYNMFVARPSVTFTNGQGVYSIKVADKFDIASGYTVANFMVNAQVVHSNPNSLSVTTAIRTDPTEGNFLDITIKAIHYGSSAWSNIPNASYPVNLNVIVV